MFYTMTLNPALDYNMTTEEFTEGRVNRSVKEEMIPGGKGLMVSRMLKNLGVESTAFGLVAGFTGTELTRLIREAGVRTDFVCLPSGTTRINVKLWGALEGEINAGGPVCDEESLRELFDKLAVLTKEDFLVLSGSVPKSLSKDLYVEMMRRVAKQNPWVAVDATGDLLRNVLAYRPFLVKPNHHELGELYDVTLTTKEEVLPFAKKLREEGARNVLVSMAGAGAVLAAEDGSVWFGEAPKGKVVNTVGSGDSMVAGFLAAYEKAKSPEEAFRNGIASGSASAFSASLGTKKEVELLSGQVRITRVE
ncbi:MAG: 1-phosphofructokinase [Lachnospiraceae bacterium]|nr:1-phosphofructokinase [Lachnospiraceae bacterium]